MTSGDTYRYVIKRQIMNLFNGHPDAEAIADCIEHGCYNETLQSIKCTHIIPSFTDRYFVGRYSAITYRVISNLDPRSPVNSEYLIAGISQGDISPDNICKMSSSELAPDANKELRTEIDIRRNLVVKIKVSRAYKCNLCFHNETTYVIYQSTASDEGSTKSVKCVRCNNVWRC